MTHSAEIDAATTRLLTLSLARWKALFGEVTLDDYYALAVAAREVSTSVIPPDKPQPLRLDRPEYDYHTPPDQG